MSTRRPALDRLAAFREEARRFIYLAGGLNAATQVRLRALAEKHGLSAAEMEEGIKLATAVERDAEPPEVEAFRMFVLGRFKDKDLLLTPAARQELQTIGTETHGLTDSQAAEVISAVVSQKEGEATHPITRKEKGTRGRWLTMGAALAGAAVCVLVLSVGMMILVSVLLRSQRVSSPPTQPAPPDPPEPPPAPLAWGQADVVKALALAEERHSSEKYLWTSIDLAVEADRSAAYEKLFAKIPALVAKPLDDEPVGALLACCLAAEPSDANAQLLREYLWKRLPGHSPLPLEVAAYEFSFWSLRVILTAIANPATAPARAEPLTIALERSLGAKVDRTKRLDDLLEASGSALFEKQYREVIVAAEANPQKALTLRDALAARAARHMDANRQERLDTEFLVIALKSSGENWKLFEPLLLHLAMKARDLANVNRILAFYEKTPKGELQDKLEECLTARTGVQGGGTSPAQFAAAVRDKLGLTDNPAPTTNENRLLKFKKLAEVALAQRSANADQADKLLQEIVHLNYVATLACALAQRAAGYARFDELVEKPKLLDKPEKKAPVKPPAGGVGVMPRVLDDPAVEQQLLALQRGKPTDRANAFQSLSEFIAAGLEITVPLAETLAGYMLLRKEKTEFEALVTNLGPLAKNRAMLLALADQLSGTQLTPAMVSRMLAEMLGTPVKFASSAWKEESRKLLLQQVLKDLAGGEDMIDKGAELLLRLYQEQGFLLGMNSANFNQVTQPGQTIEVIVLHLHAKLTKEKPDENKDTLAKVNREVTAGQFLARNDLQRAALMQRQWLHLLTIHVAREKPERAADAEALGLSLREEDAKATHILQQLRAGEERGLRMWMLLLDSK